MSHMDTTVSPHNIRYVTCAGISVAASLALFTLAISPTVALDLVGAQPSNATWAVPVLVVAALTYPLYRFTSRWSVQRPEDPQTRHWLRAAFSLLVLVSLHTAVVDQWGLLAGVAALWVAATVEGFAWMFALGRILNAEAPATDSA